MKTVLFNHRTWFQTSYFQYLPNPVSNPHFDGPERLPNRLFPLSHFLITPQYPLRIHNPYTYISVQSIILYSSYSVVTWSCVDRRTFTFFYRLREPSTLHFCFYDISVHFICKYSTDGLRYIQYIYCCDSKVHNLFYLETESAPLPHTGLDCLLPPDERFPSLGTKI